MKNTNFPCSSFGSRHWPRPDTDCPQCAEAPGPTKARYYTDGYGVRKCPPDGRIYLRDILGAEWSDSAFSSMEELMEDEPGSLREMTEEEGEP